VAGAVRPGNRRRDGSASEKNGLERGQELHDGQGRPVGVFLHADAAAELTAERDRLRAEVSELNRALDEAREELKDKAALTNERDVYLKALHKLLWKDVPFTEEDIAEWDRTGLTLNQFIGEIENPPQPFVVVMPESDHPLEGGD
jgi:hypothetical protein